MRELFNSQYEQAHSHVSESDEVGRQRGSNGGREMEETGNFAVKALTANPEKKDGKQLLLPITNMLQ